MLVRGVKLFFLLALLSAAGIVVASCGGSKANVTNDNTTAQPAVIEVTTATAIMRELPKFFEATGSLTGDQQTDVAPSVAGKVVYIGVELGSFVKRGQTIGSHSQGFQRANASTRVWRRRAWDAKRSRPDTTVFRDCGTGRKG